MKANDSAGNDQNDNNIVENDNKNREAIKENIEQKIEEKVNTNIVLNSDYDTKEVLKLIQESTAEPVQTFQGPETETDNDTVKAAAEIPSTSLNSKKTITIEDIDKRARNAPACCKDSFEKLNDYLMKDLNEVYPDWYRVRSLLVWLSDQNIQEAVVFKSESKTTESEQSETPASLLVKIKNNECSYAQAFVILCQNVKIECKVVWGYAKAGNYQPGDDVTTHQIDWNIVKLNDQPFIVNTLWICTSLKGLQPGGWLQIEKDGQRDVFKTEASKGTVVNAFKEYYFMTPPEQHIYKAFPKNPDDQLLAKPLSLKDFEKKAFIERHFFELGLSLISKDRCRLKSKDGIITIKLNAPKKVANSIQMHYILSFKEESIIANKKSDNNTDGQNVKMESGKLTTKSESEINHNDNTFDNKSDNNEREEGQPAATMTSLADLKDMPRLVAMIRNVENWTFRVQFPIEGIYKLEIFGGIGAAMGRVTSFKLVCQKRRENFMPLPIDAGKLGFGPGPELEAAGLLFPSHKNGEYQVDLGRPTAITFYAKEIKECAASLLVSRRNNDTGSFEVVSHDSWVAPSINHATSQLRISTNIQEPGEYALRISYGKNVEQANNIICNYLLVYDGRQRRESYECQHARKELRHVLDILPMEGITTESLIYTANLRIKHCLSVGIPDNDDDIAIGLSTLEQFIRIQQDMKLMFDMNHKLVSSAMSVLRHARKDLQKKYQQKRNREQKKHFTTSTKNNIVCNDLDKHGTVSIENTIKSCCEKS